VIFNRPNTTISGNARFYNVQIAAIDATIDTIADITNQAGSTMKIGGAITRTGLATGKWYADVFGATVEYNGGSQTVLLPDGSPNYHNLILSGSGTKTLPSGLSMHGDFIITGTALGVAGGPVTTNGNMSIGPNASYTAGSYAHTNGGFIIYSDASGTGSLIASSSFSGTVERYIAKDIKWHFLASPIAAQPIWPEFAPAPFDDPLTFGASPWGWDFYYWNPKALTASELYWVNLRQDNSGTYNARSIDATGSLAGFGTATPEFAIGRGYLAAYNANWSPSTGSPEIHRFTGSLNSGAIARAILNDANPYNLVGNPFPSSIDWQSTGWAGQRDALANNGGGYDYWIYNDSDANYGVFNSATGEGTHSTSRYIAPMQGFFVQANTSGTLNMSNVQVHSSQTWLKDGVDTDNMLRLKLTTSANTFNDEMLVAVNAAYENGGSPKFWSMENDSPELYSIRGSSSYSIDRLSAVDENSVVVLGVSAKLTGSYTIKATGVSSFSAASSLILEDLKTGNTQELKSNPIYTFSANSGDNPERFHLHFVGPFGINSQEDQSGFAIFSYEHSVYVKNISGREPNGKVSICNILGQKIIQKNIVEDLTKIDLAVSPGCYIVTLTSKNQITSKKVFIR
jgi:hypothetical protein